GIAVFPDERRDARLQLERARAAQEVVHPPRAVLEGELDVVEPGFLERRQARLGETHPRGDEVGIEAEAVRGRDQDLEILPGERLAAGETELHRSQCPRLLEDAQPLCGLELGADGAEVGRVVAEDAVQGAAVGQLEKQPERRSGARGDRLAHARSSTQLRSTARAMNAQTSAVSPVAEYARSRSATMSATVRAPSQRVRIAAALRLSFTIPSG